MTIERNRKSAVIAGGAGATRGDKKTSLSAPRHSGGNVEAMRREPLTELISVSQWEHRRR